MGTLDSAEVGLKAHTEKCLQAGKETKEHPDMSEEDGRPCCGGRWQPAVSTVHHPSGFQVTLSSAVTSEYCTEGQGRTNQLLRLLRRGKVEVSTDINTLSGRTEYGRRKSDVKQRSVNLTSLILNISARPESVMCR